MTLHKPKTLQELVRMKGIKLKEFKGIIAKQTYYNIIDGTHRPGKKTIEKLCQFLEIDESSFKKLLKCSHK